MGLLLITAAFCLVGYNYYESYKAGQASESILSELEEAIAAGETEASSGDGAGSSDGEASDESETSEQEGAATAENGRSASDSASGSASNQDGVNLGELYPDRDMPQVFVNNIGYAGYIFIPSLSLRLPVQNDWVYDLLTISPARYSGSVYQNNLVIGGHSYITHFRGLRGIAPGSKVIFYDAEGFSYEYEVSYVMSLNPDQGAVLLDEQSEDWDLTLFTCNTGGQTRCIVRCAAVE